MRAFKWSARCVGILVICAAGLHVLPWWFTLLVGVPLIIDALSMLHGVVQP